MRSILNIPGVKEIITFDNIYMRVDDKIVYPPLAMLAKAEVDELELITDEDEHITDAFDIKVTAKKAYNNRNEEDTEITFKALRNYGEWFRNKHILIVDVLGNHWLIVKDRINQHDMNVKMTIAAPGQQQIFEHSITVKAAANILFVNMTFE